MSADEKLEACPFCGGSSMYASKSMMATPTQPAAFIRCLDCKAQNETKGGAPSTVVARCARAWNTRPLESALRAEVAEARREQVLLLEQNERLMAHLESQERRHREELAAIMAEVQATREAFRECYQSTPTPQEPT